MEKINKDIFPLIPQYKDKSKINKLMTDLLNCFNDSERDLMRGFIAEYAEEWFNVQIETFNKNIDDNIQNG